MTLCNINQGRSSLFRQFGLSSNSSLLSAVLRQAYLGSASDLDEAELEAVRSVFSASEVVRNGVLADVMCEDTPYRDEANGRNLTGMWEEYGTEEYVADAGWYFKTLAVQEIGKKKERVF